jgi:hypothetical protein
LPLGIEKCRRIEHHRLARYVLQPCFMRGSEQWVVAGLIACAACGDPDPSSLDGTSFGSNDGLGDRVVSLRIDPPPASREVVLGQSPPLLALHVLAASANGVETDVTARVTWSVDRAAVASMTPNGTLTLAGIGGTATLSATLGDVHASAPLTVRLTGAVFGEGTTASAPAAFAAPIVSSLPDQLEYPPDGVVAPANIAPFEIQWSAPAGAAIHRIRITSGAILDLELYTTRPVLLVPADVWAKIGATAPDAPITIATESVDARSSRRHVSSPRTMTLTAETFPQPIVFTHKTGGGIHALDVGRGVELSLVTNGAQSKACAGCHVVSKNGRRMSFAVNDANLSLGTAQFDDSRRMFAERISPTTLVHAPSAAFNPAEDASRPSMLTTTSAAAPATNATLSLLDPDTGAVLPSDLASMLGAVPAAIGGGATMPAWSMAGDLVVFTGYEHEDPTDPRPGVNVLQGSIVESGASFVSGAFHFDAPRVLVAGTATESDVRPSLSPDGSAVAFMRTVTGGAEPLTSSMLVRRRDGHVFAIDAGRGEQGVSDTRTPDWGPVSSRAEGDGPSTSKYAWVVVSSSRAYGHLLGPSLQRQLWIFAVDRAKLDAGEADPSAPAFHVSGQDLDVTYAHPQWPLAVPKLTP